MGAAIGIMSGGTSPFNVELTGKLAGIGSQAISTGAQASINGNKINLFDAKDDPKVVHDAVNNFPDSKDKNHFYVFGHAGDRGFQYTDEKGRIVGGFSPEAFNDVMSSRSPEWKKAMAENREITVTLYACNMANEAKTKNPIAKQISKMYPNVTVIAADGEVMYGLNMGRPSILGIKNKTFDGGLVGYKHGVKMLKVKMPYGKK